MKRITSLKCEFIEYIPEELKDGVIYISINFRTSIHKCCCGCGKEVVTPLSPTDWELVFDGQSISLYPSIGNWSFECQSHYWIRRNKVIWAPPMSGEEIQFIRTRDHRARERYYDGIKTSYDISRVNEPKEKIWQRLKKRLG